ncbi:hypothetical protein C3K47_09195 [Solitalea longa]|uniref:Uncharacterized protein n=1 Tax=Solitalea longa TaxID=2079460 RepID=A0A2S5A1T3_9SPHI|nr:hypothetical protein C3K47_09195 [Solitalea longa]
MCTNAQSFSEFLNDPSIKLTYLGIDFTEVRLMGDATANTYEIKNKYFALINDVVVNESLKYNIAKAFRKPSIVNNLTFVTEHNKAIDADKLVSLNQADYTRLTPEMVQQVVGNYDFGTEKGIGLMFVMEGMNKSIVAAAMYVTFIDMETRKVIFSQRMEGSAGGFGFRNYWVHPVYSVLKNIDSYEFANWKLQNKTKRNQL